MVTLRVSIVALLAIGLIANFQQASALKCYVCTSNTNEDCASDPSKLATTECKAPPTTPSPTTPSPTTPSPTTPSPTTPSPTTPSPTTPSPTTPSPTTPSPTTPSPTTPSPTTPSPTTPSPTTPSPTTPSPTTPSPTTPSPTTPSPTTPSPTTPSPTTPSPTTPSPTTPSPTTPSPTTPSPTTPSPTTPSPTTPSPTTPSPTTPSPTTPSTTTPSTTTTTAPIPEGFVYGDEQNEYAHPFVKQIVPNRFRRNAVSRAESDFTCYTLIYKEGDKDVVERGCHAKADACKTLEAQVKGSKCEACTEDGCNASSRLSLGIMSILIPLGLVAYFTR